MTGEDKEKLLTEWLVNETSLLIAYSGGVDSAYLADVAHEALGERSVLFLADSPSLPRREFHEAQRLAASRGWRLHVEHTTECENRTFLQNDGRRCYFCKSELFTRMAAYGRSQGITGLAYGENAQDGMDPTRMGSRAASEHGVYAPLRDAGLTKMEIRVLSAARGLPTAGKASVACLGSRFPSGTPISVPQMALIEKAEDMLSSLGFAQYRVRYHGPLCRIELGGGEAEHLLDARVRRQVNTAFKQIGFQHVTLDLADYEDPTCRKHGGT